MYLGRFFISLPLLLFLFVLRANAQVSAESGPDAPKVQDSVRFVVTSLRCNTAKSEFLPAFFGEKIYFMRSNQPAGKLPMLKLRWPARPQMQTWMLPNADSSKAQKRVIINDKHSSQTNYGAVNQLKNTNRIAFTRGLPRDKSDAPQPLGIYLAKVSEQVWYNIEPFPGNRFPFSVAHPAFSADGRSLYFASDAPGGLGESDLYVCHLDSAGQWGKPLNLGPRVNGPGNEMFPSLHEDGTLYFASDRPGGLGGFDLYEAVRSRHSPSTFSRTVALGAPINSPADEFGLIVNEPKRIGYFTSNRTGGKGGYDLYRVDIRLLHHSRNITDEGDGVFGHIPLELTGSVLDSSTNEPLPKAVVKLRDFNQDDISITYTDRLGRYHFAITNENKYQIAVSKVGYQTTGDQQFSTYGVKEKMEMNVDLVMAPMAYKLTLKVSVTGQAGSGDQLADPAIPRSHIKLEDVTTDQLHEYSTDDQGMFTFTLDQGKIYKLSASAEGFLPSLPYRISTTNTTNSRTLEMAIPLTKDRRPPKRRNKNMVCVQVKDGRSGKPIIGSDVRFYDIMPQNPLKVATNDRGHAWIEVDTSLHAFRVEAQVAGYQMKDFMLVECSKIAPGDTLTVELPLAASKYAPVPLDLTIAPVYYPAGQQVLPVAVQKSLNRVVDLLHKYPSLKINVLAHTDQQLPKTVGTTLSRRRAMAVAAYLVSHKIARQRIGKLDGLGKTQPRHNCLDVICNEQQKRENRRVEFEITAR